MDLEHIIRKIFLVNAKNREWRQVLPRLTESDKVDLQLYAFLALACRQFVSSWHSGIIDDDAQFLYDLCDALAHVVKVIEQRVQQRLALQMDDIFLDDIPYIIQCHIEDLRTIKERKEMGLIPHQVSLGDSFHAIRPLKQLDSPENEALFIKLLSRGLTALVLEEKDANSVCASSFLSSLVGDIVLRNVIERLSQPWTWHELVLKVLEILKRKTGKEAAIAETEAGEAPTDHPAERSFTLFDPEVPLSLQIQHLQTKAVNFSTHLIKTSGRILAYVIPLVREAKVDQEGRRFGVKKPQLVDRVIFGFFVSLLRVQQRSPLLVDTFRIIAAPFRGGILGAMASRFAYSFLQGHLVSEDLIVMILDNARKTLFSNDGYMGPPRIIPTPEEQVVLREKALQGIIDAAPDFMTQFVYGKDPHQSVDEILSLFDDATINKHLIYGLISYFVIQMFPELETMGIEELVKGKGKGKDMPTPVPQADASVQ